MKREDWIALWSEIEAVRYRGWRRDGDETNRPMFEVKLRAMAGDNPGDRIFGIAVYPRSRDSYVGGKDLATHPSPLAVLLSILAQDRWEGLRTDMKVKNGVTAYVHIHI